MWQIIIVIAAIAVVVAYVAYSLARSARGQACHCGTGTCSLQDHRASTSLPCQNASPAISAESLEESARNLAGKQTAGPHHP
jgi:hypothetical protein